MLSSDVQLHFGQEGTGLLPVRRRGGGALLSVWLQHIVFTMQLVTSHESEVPRGGKR